MSLVEKARERVEEARTRITTRIEAIRGGGSSPELPTLKEIRKRGVLAVLEEKFPRVKGIREKGILAGRLVTPPTPEEKAPTPTTTKEVKGEVELKKVLA